MNRIFFLMISLCCLMNTVDAKKCSKRHRQFQAFVHKERSNKGNERYSVDSSLFKSGYDELVQQGTAFVNDLVTDVSAREQNLELKRDCGDALKKGGQGLKHLCLGTVLFGLGLHNVLDMRNKPQSNYLLLVGQGLSWGSIFFGSSYMYSGVKKLYKSIFFKSIITDQLKREMTLHKALKNPDRISKN